MRLKRLPALLRDGASCARPGQRFFAAGGGLGWHWASSEQLADHQVEALQRRYAELGSTSTVRSSRRRFCRMRPAAAIEALNASSTQSSNWLGDVPGFQPRSGRAPTSAYANSRP